MDVGVEKVEIRKNPKYGLLSEYFKELAAVWTT
jgi:hypothetical protein